MASCRCTSLKHENHPGRVCENLATESDGYCKACHDLTRGDAKLRYRSPAVPADVEQTADGFRLRFDEPAYGIATGQTAGDPSCVLTCVITYPCHVVVPSCLRGRQAGH